MSNAVKLNILFYLEECQYCQNFIRSLKTDDLLKYFKMINIKTMRNIPKNITRVPAIITADTGQIFLADDAFKWLQGIKYLRQQMNNINEQNKKIIQFNQYKQRMANNGGPNGYVHAEMTGFSDNYAYTNQDINKDIDIAQAKSFQQYNANISSNDIIITPPVEEAKIDEGLHKNRINDIINNRKQQNAQFSEHYKQEQLEAIMRIEGENIIHNNNNNYNQFT